MKKSILLVCLIVPLLAGLCFGASAMECEEFDGSNISSQNYSMWASPVKSYLSFSGDDKLMRVQYLPSDGRVLIEYYDSSYNIVSRRYIEKELPVFGGFYAADDAFYILTGQNNPNEKDSTEVFRITKYDKSWNRLSAASLYGANTTVPFDAGSARFAKSGKYIIIRTAHEMYTTPDDGLNHQANVTIQLDSEKMVITDYFADILNYDYGYVSHSFNQFVKVDDDRIVALDHGDAHPRSIVLLKYKTKVSSGKFFPSYYNTCQAIDMFSIAGSYGDNYTGCSVGGFEISDSSYIAAISSVEQGSSSYVRNIYISVLGKNSSVPTVKKLTDYTDNSSTPSTPHLVKIGGDSFVVLWEKENRVYYAELDGEGSLKGDICSLQGNLSDCVPVVKGEKLIWYVWNENEITFYEIVPDKETGNKTVINTYHSFNMVSASGSEVTLKCSKCQTTKKGSVPTSFRIWWEIKNSYSAYSDSPESKYHPGDCIGLWVRFTEADYNEYEVVSSNTNVMNISYDAYGDPVAEMLGEGTAKITVRSKYSSDISKSYTVKVAHSWSENTVKATCTDSGQTVKICNDCGESKTETLPALGHDMSDYEVTKEPTCTAQGKKVATCSRCDEEVSEAIAKIAHDKNTNIKGTSATCTKSGKTAGKKCSMCGKVTVEQEIIPALGHDMSDYKVTKEPTCTAQGKKVATCSRCDEEASETIAKLGHSYSEYEVTKEPTCTAMGEKTAYCIRCKQTVKEDIARVSHKEVVVEAMEATCTKTGKTQGKKCEVCGRVLEEQRTLDKLGHNIKETVVTKATGENHGEISKQCTRCGESESQRVYMIKTAKMAKERYAYNGKTPKVLVKIIDSQKNVLKEGEDYTVSVGSAKKVGTHTATVKFKGKYEGSEKLSFDIVPGRTSKITASESTSYIKLTWQKVSGATGYRVYQYDSKTKSYKLLTSIKGKNSYTVKKLKSGTAYKFAVKAYTKQGDGTVYWGSSVKAQFATKPAKTAITLKSTAKKTAVVSWNKVSGASAYQIYYSTAKDGKYTKLTNTTALRFKKTGLKSGKTYYFKVRAYKKVGGKTVYGAFSEIKSIKVK